MTSNEDSSESLVTVEQGDATDKSNALFMLYTTANNSYLPFMDDDPSDDVTAFLEPFKGSYSGEKIHDQVIEEASSLIETVDQRFVQECLFVIGAPKSWTGQKGIEALISWINTDPRYRTLNILTKPRMRVVVPKAPLLSNMHHLGTTDLNIFSGICFK